MDKVAEMFCKQNPNMELNCGNTECKNIIKVKSRNVFKNKQYSFTCEQCGKSTEYDTSKFADDFVKQLKKMGITLK